MQIGSSARLTRGRRRDFSPRAGLHCRRVAELQRRQRAARRYSL